MNEGKLKSGSTQSKPNRATAAKTAGSVASTRELQSESSDGVPVRGESSFVPSSDRTFLPLGTVGKAYGIRGAFHARLYNPESLAFESLERVQLAQGTKSKTFDIVEVSPRPKGLVLRLAGLSSPEATAEWTGAQILAERAKLPPLEPGEYYLIDLVGCEVWLEANDDTSEPSSRAGLKLGEVSEVRSDPSCDTAVVRRADGTLFEFAVLPEWVASVDVEARRVELSSEEGLIES